MHRVVAITSVVLSFLSPLAAGQGRVEFPPAKPEEVGLSTAALEELDKVIDGYIDRDEAVGAELLVIKDRKAVWRSAHGLSDREGGTKFQTGSIYCVRSMTKPFVGTAIQMLIDEGKVALTDRAAKYLACFDNDEHRDITIQQLLTHSSGLRLSSLLTTELKTLKSVQDVAALAGGSPLEAPPGQQFSYSDDGTDTLTAIVEKASGMAIAEFLQKRILDPVGMHDTMPVASKQDPRRAKMVPLYVGGAGAWSKHWSPSDDATFPLFPYFLGSQTMYSTCEDYARFLCLWADGGRVGKGEGATRLLSEEAVERGLTPAFTMNYPTGLGGLRVDYAQLWMTWVDDKETPPKVVAFGHGGSDGTQGWMWPDRELIVLYCTQSRGGLTTIQIEGDIQRLLLKVGEGDSDAVKAEKAAAATVERGECIGLYEDLEHDTYVAVTEKDEKLWVESPGRYTGALVQGPEAGKWKFELDPTAVIEFKKGKGESPAADAHETFGGPVNSVDVRVGGEVKSYARLIPAKDLPGVDEIVARVMAAHGTSNLSESHAIRRTGTTELPALKRTVNFTSIFGPTKMRTEVKAVGGQGQVIVSDGTSAWSRVDDKEVQEVKGATAQQTFLENPAWIFGDWRPHYASVEVVRRATRDGKTVLAVRCVPTSAYPCTMLVSEETGEVIGQERIAIIPGLGAVGVSVRYSDVREVGGVRLPFAAKTKYATPMLGEVTTNIEAAEIIEVTPGMFELAR